MKQDLSEMAAIEISSVPHSELSEAEKTDIRIPPRVARALGLLLQAHEYVQDLDANPWEFALEISCLRRLKLTNSDFRWLVHKGLAEHGIEVTLAGDSERSFRRPGRLIFCRKTCFIIAPVGVELAREFRGVKGYKGERHDPPRTPKLTVSPALHPLVPTWDRHRQELRVGTIVVKAFKVPAANQESILAAFQEEGWPTRIDDPLPQNKEQSPKRRLQETIKSLNRNQKRSLIRFVGDGSGEGVRWEFNSPQREAEV